MPRARCQIARHIVKYTTPRAVGNIMFPLPLRIPIRPDPFPHASPIRPLAPPSHPLFQVEGPSTIRWTSSQIAGGGSQALSLSLFFHPFRIISGGGEGWAKSLLRVSFVFKSCFCFPFYSGRGWLILKRTQKGWLLKGG